MGKLSRFSEMETGRLIFKFFHKKITLVETNLLRTRITDIKLLEGLS